MLKQRFSISLPKNAIWIGVILLIIALFFGPTDNWSWDPSFYYAQLRSPIIDRDVDFREEVQTGQITLQQTATGLIGSVWPIGPSLAWMPFFLTAHFGALLWPAIPADGLSYPYIALVSLGSVVYSFIGIAVCFQIVRRSTDSFVAGIASVLCLFATPLFFYSFRQPIMAHAISFCVVAILVFTYFQLRHSVHLHPYSGLLFGLLIGLCFLMRWNGLLMAIIPISYFLEQFWRVWKQRSWLQGAKLAIQIIIFQAALLLTISPQLVLWEKLYGTWLRIPQGQSTFVDSFLPVNIGKVLFSTNRGFLFWAPFTLIGISGLFWIRDQVVRWTLLLTVAVHLILVGYRRDWFGGGGFGCRYVIELLPLLVVGFAELMRRWPRWSISLLAVASVAHQMALMFAVEHGVSGWVDLAVLGKGQPIGVIWQWQVFAHLALHPLDWFLPRPFVGMDRQTLITCVLHGLSASPIIILAIIITPVLSALGLLCQCWLRQTQPVYWCFGMLAYLVGFAFFLFLL